MRTVLMPSFASYFFLHKTFVPTASKNSHTIVVIWKADTTRTGVGSPDGVLVPVTLGNFVRVHGKRGQEM